MEIEKPTMDATIESLNEDCLLHIFKHLQLDDSINLATTCRRLRDSSYHKFKKYSNLELDSTMMRKGNNYIGLIFSHIGPHITSLTINDGFVRFNVSKIFEVCENLKSLRLDHYNWESEEIRNEPLSNSSNNVESLTLNNCYFVPGDCFVESFNKLKYLSIRTMAGEPKSLKDVLNNNPDIESVICQSELPDFEIFHRIPNVKRLSLCVRDNVMKLSALLKLDHLTKLQLDCQYNNINSFLKVVAKKGILEEMELASVQVDDDFFDIIQSFDKLQLLVVAPFHHWKLKSSTKWPANLTSLRLMHLEFALKNFVSTFEQLERLEYIDLNHCFTVKHENSCLADATKLVRQIINTITISNGKQKRHVILPDCVNLRNDNSKLQKYLIDLDRIRIYRATIYLHNLLQIGVQHPGHENFYL